MLHVKLRKITEYFTSLMFKHIYKKKMKNTLGKYGRQDKKWHPDKPDNGYSENTEREMNEAKIQTKEHKTWEALCNI
jgi:hypothetical protein